MTIRKTGSKRRKMYFRGTSKRDSQVSPEVEERNYRNAFTMYCSECMEKYGLEEGKLAIRRIGVCAICGNDGFISGCLGNEHVRIKSVKLYYSKDGQWDEETLEKIKSGQCLQELEGE